MPSVAASNFLFHQRFDTYKTGPNLCSHLSAELGLCPNSYLTPLHSTAECSCSEASQKRWRGIVAVIGALQRQRKTSLPVGTGFLNRKRYFPSRWPGNGRWPSTPLL